MKTIKKIADEIGVSKEAVRKKIAKLGLQLDRKVGTNILVVDSDQEYAIKKEFSAKTTNQTANVGTNQTANVGTNQTANQDTISLQVIDMLRNELEKKDGQIDELNNRLADALKVADQAQQLHGANQVQLLESKKKKSWFFRKKDRN